MPPKPPEYQISDPGVHTRVVKFSLHETSWAGDGREWVHIGVPYEGDRYPDGTLTLNVPVDALREFLRQHDGPVARHEPGTSMPVSIVQGWVVALSLRHQGVLVAAVRGCDTARRHDSSKLLSRCLRAEILVPATEKPTSFIEFVHDDLLLQRMDGFMNDWDHYPMHFVMHFVHAAAVVGYHHPTRGAPWLRFYEAACRKLHVQPETKEMLDARLTAPEKEFQAAQDSRLSGGA